MPAPSALRCIRCSRAFALQAYARGCPHCEAEGVAANLTVDYASNTSLRRADIPSAPRSMWRFDALLPANAGDAVSLGEGNTPLVPLIA